MSLLTRIAISNGNPTRREAANRHILERDHKIEECWNQQLELEIQKKRELYLPIVHPSPVPHSRTLAFRMIADLEHQMEERWQRQFEMAKRKKMKRLGASDRLLNQLRSPDEELPVAH